MTCKSLCWTGCAVSTNTKIQIWKQITTIVSANTGRSLLYQPIQKYKFESKSQLKALRVLPLVRCINQYKNTNLKANHNQAAINNAMDGAVSTNTKIQIWKQITTKMPTMLLMSRLYQPIQKYKFESKSQPLFRHNPKSHSCINQYKNTNLKANHNYSNLPTGYNFAVSTNTKIQIWKQITTVLMIFTHPSLLYQPIQKYKFESKSQPISSSLRRNLRCINQYKNTNLKANHNKNDYDKLNVKAVSTNTKIQIWKQITTNVITSFSDGSCINQYKNTNLKANHNQPIRFTYS